MNRTKMLTLIALTVVFLSYVGVGEATASSAEIAVPTVTESSSLDVGVASNVGVSNAAHVTSTGTVVLSFAARPFPFPTDCSPGIACTSQYQCGFDPVSGCFQGVCNGGSCFCY